MNWYTGTTTARDEAPPPVEERDERSSRRWGRWPLPSSTKTRSDAWCGKKDSPQLWPLHFIPSQPDKLVHDAFSILADLLLLLVLQDTLYHAIVDAFLLLIVAHQGFHEALLDLN
ncbi:Os04g0416800 [Oryza sativa Japonica Group]|uniref:Uncharacterized protein n=2 Tax=Oryza sativa subsp. japonica TaxID=39947 RepID=A0A8J8XQB2_ORYSJ|nr:hypothetical protein OsJ_14763 [Oryza sativa Japonica Group]BAS89162.1 Os04g0416800 [Oryza sativa Japonica Group]